MVRLHGLVAFPLLLAAGGVLAQDGPSNATESSVIPTDTTTTTFSWPLNTLGPTHRPFFPVLLTSAKTLETPSPSRASIRQSPISLSPATSLDTPSSAPTISSPILSIPGMPWTQPLPTMQRPTLEGPASSFAAPTTAGPANSFAVPAPVPQGGSTTTVVPGAVNDPKNSQSTPYAQPTQLPAPNGGNAATPGPIANTPSPTAFVISSQTLAPSQPVVLSQGSETVTISLTTDSAGSTNVVFGTSTQPLSMFLSSNPGVSPVAAPTQQAAPTAVTVAGVAFSVNPTATGLVQVGSTSLSVGQTFTQGTGPSATVFSVQTASGGGVQVVVLGPSTTLTQAIATASSTSTPAPNHVMSSITVNTAQATSPGAASATKTGKSNAQRVVVSGATVMSSSFVWWSLVCYAMA